MAPPKRTLRWRDDDVLSFIQCYKELDCLWNPKLVDYRDPRKRAKAYEILKNKMNTKGLLKLTVNDVRTKIKGLRTTYCDELRKIIKSSRSSRGQYEPKLFWFNIADSFLRGVTEQRKPASVNEIRQLKVKTIVPNKSKIECTTNDTQHETTTTRSSDDVIIYQASTSSCNLSDNPNNITTRDCQQFDEFDHFARSIAIQLRKLPELDALELMQEMQVLLITKKRKLLLDDESRNLHQKRGRKISENITEDSNDAMVEYSYEEDTDPLDESGSVTIKNE